MAAFGVYHRGEGADPWQGWFTWSFNVQFKLNELSEQKMASVNKVILIGSLGRVSRDSLDATGQELFDSYFDALRGYGCAFKHFTCTLAAAARRLNELFRQLHSLAGHFVIPRKIVTRRTPVTSRTAAFFHAAKVDARNLP